MSRLLSWQNDFKLKFPDRSTLPLRMVNLYPLEHRIRRECKTSNIATVEQWIDFGGMLNAFKQILIFKPIMTDLVILDISVMITVGTSIMIGNNYSAKTSDKRT